MTMISDLSHDLVEEILSRVPITRAIRSTCKQWNTLSKDPNFTKKFCNFCSKASKKSPMIMTYDTRGCLTRVNLLGIHNHEDNLLDLSTKQLAQFEQGYKSRVLFYCDGLLLCDNDGELMVWNPYLGQVRGIQPIESSKYCIGYDNNRNHKILMFHDYQVLYADRGVKNKIYDFQSNSWRVLEAAPIECFHQRGVSLKGNSYFVAHDRLEGVVFLLCFDFTREIFGPHLLLPFPSYSDCVILSTVVEEQLAVLFKKRNTCEVDIWVSTKVDPNAVSWNKFLKIDMASCVDHLPCAYMSFFVVEKKKVVVICDGYTLKRADSAYMVREDGYYKDLDIGESLRWPIMFSYVPSSVQIQQQGLMTRNYT